MKTKDRKSKKSTRYTQVNFPRANPGTQEVPNERISYKKSNRPPEIKRPKKAKIWLWVVGFAIIFWAAIFFFLLSSGKGDQKVLSNLSVPDVHSLAFSPTNSNTVFFGSHNGLLKSDDGGRSWKATSLKNQDAMGIGSGGDGQAIYISGHEVFQKSGDGGNSWRSLLDKLPATDIHALSVDPANSAHLFAFAVGQGLIESSDGGLTWKTITNQLGNGVAALAYGDKTLWAAVIGRGVLRSLNGGTVWEAASGYANSSLAPSNRVTGLAFSNSDKTLFAGTADGLYKSPDGGSSWNRLTFNGDVATLAVNPLNSKNLLVVNGKGEVFRSEDGGISWPDK